MGDTTSTSETSENLARVQELAAQCGVTASKSPRAALGRVDRTVGPWRAEPGRRGVFWGRPPSAAWMAEL